MSRAMTGISRQTATTRTRQSRRIDLPRVAGFIPIGGPHSDACVSESGRRRNTSSRRPRSFSWFTHAPLQVYLLFSGKRNTAQCVGLRIKRHALHTPIRMGNLMPGMHTLPAAMMMTRYRLWREPLGHQPKSHVLQGKVHFASQPTSDQSPFGRPRNLLPDAVGSVASLAFRMRSGECAISDWA